MDSLSIPAGSGFVKRTGRYDSGLADNGMRSSSEKGLSKSGRSPVTSIAIGEAGLLPESPIDERSKKRFLAREGSRNQAAQ